MKTAALLVIGDEILSGKVKDDNSFVFAQAMYNQGIKVERIVTIPDQIDVIADKVAKCASKFDYLCTSGGVGPTHDDKTFDGVAMGLSLPLIEHKEALAYFKQQQYQAGKGEEVSLTQRKMLSFPTPCTIHFIPSLWLPLVVVKNVYIFPGVPYLFAKMMNHLAHLFQGGQFFYTKIFTNEAESAIANALNLVQNEYPEIAIGSYPQLPDQDHNVMVIVEGQKQEIVDIVVKKLIPLIGGQEITTYETKAKS